MKEVLWALYGLWIITVMVSAVSVIATVFYSIVKDLLNI